MAAATKKRTTAPEEAEVVSQTVGEKELGKKRAPRPTFELVKIGEAFPEKPKGGGRGRGKSTEYFDALKQIMDINDGEVYQFAVFHTPQGAGTACRRIEKGEVKMPEGKWQIEARTNKAEGKSVLLARYLGAK